MAKHCANCNKKLKGFEIFNLWQSDSFHAELNGKPICNDCFRGLLRQQTETRHTTKDVVESKDVPRQTAELNLQDTDQLDEVAVRSAKKEHIKNTISPKTGQLDSQYMNEVETKSVYVLHSDSDAIVRQMDLFGWKLVGNEDGGIKDKKNFSWYSNFAENGQSYHCRKLDFARKLDMPNLAKIRQLEKQYIFGFMPQPVSSISEKPEPDWLWSLDMIVLIFGGLGVVFFIATFVGVKNDFWNFSYGGGLIGFGIAAGTYAVTRVVRYFWKADLAQSNANQQSQRENIETNRGYIEKELATLKEEASKQ